VRFVSPLSCAVLLVALLSGCSEAGGGLDPDFVDPREKQIQALDDVGESITGRCVGEIAAPAGDLDGDGYDGFAFTACVESDGSCSSSTGPSTVG
jgi:hypothetical protein